MIIQKVCSVMCPFTRTLMMSRACTKCLYMEDYNEQTVTCKYIIETCDTSTR